VTHLRELACIPLLGDKLSRFGDRLLIGSLHGPEPRALTVVELEPTPRVVSELPFKHQIQALTTVGDVGYVFEAGRAIHLVQLDRNPPIAEDCVLMFRQQIYRFAHVGARWLVLARNWEGVSVLDVSDPVHPRETDARKLGDSFCEDVVVVGERVFCAAHGDGLVELRIDEAGKLVEVGRWLGGEDQFGVDKIYVVGDSLWLFGNGALPYAKREAEEAEEAAEAGDDGDDDEDYEEEEEEADTVILPLADLSTPRWFGASGVQPRGLQALDDGTAIAFEGYRCWHLTGRGKGEVLFQRYERDDTKAYVEVGGRHDRAANISIADDVTGWIRIGERLYLKSTTELRVYAFDPASPIARVVPG
jgi:hypothetical protein